MTLEDLCVSLELAKELREAGYPQISFMAWQNNKLRDYGLYDWTKASPEAYASPTASELGEQLPAWFKHDGYEDGGPWHLSVDKQLDDTWACLYWGWYSNNKVLASQDNVKGDFYRTVGATQPEAMAKMWLYLKKNNSLEAPQEKR